MLSRARSTGRRIPRPLLWSAGVLALVVGAVVGGGAIVRSALEVPDLREEATATSAVPSGQAVEGDLTVTLDAAARPADGAAPDHLRIQPVVDLDASQLPAPVLVTLAAVGTAAGPLRPAGDGGGPPAGPLDPWAAATETSIQQVVAPGEGERGLRSIRVELPCELDAPCAARWRYRIEPLDPTEGAPTTLAWRILAEAVYGSGEQLEAPPDGATLGVDLGDAQVVAPSTPPAAELAASQLVDGAVVTVVAPARPGDAVVRAALVAEGSPSSTGFALVPDPGLAGDRAAAVGPLVWEVPVVAGACDGANCVLHLAVEGAAPPGSSLRIDGRAGPGVDSPSISEQLTVNVT